MAFVLADRVKDTTTTTGTGTITLSGTAPAGYQSFAVIGNANTTYYTLADTNNWEVGIGTYTSVGPTLSRDTVLASSNSGNLVNFSAGSKDAFVTYPAERAVMTDVAQTLTTKTISGSSNTITNVSLTTGVTGTLPTANGGTNLTTFTAANYALYSTSSSVLTAGTLPVAAGGTGAATFTANNVLLGNGTSALQVVAPGTTGNVLTSNGTTWASTAPPAGALIYTANNFGGF